MKHLDSTLSPTISCGQNALITEILYLYSLPVPNELQVKLLLCLFCASTSLVWKINHFTQNLLSGRTFE